MGSARINITETAILSYSMAFDTIINPMQVWCRKCFCGVRGQIEFMERVARQFPERC